MAHKVFVVDDDPFFGQMLQDHLSENKMYEVSLISTGQDCLDRLFEEPDVIILDYHLDANAKNSDNGLAILEKIKKFSARIHVVMLSGQMHYGVAAKTIAKGAEQYVMKDEEAFKNIDLILKDLVKV